MGLGQKDPVLSPGDSCYLERALYPAPAGTCLQHTRQKMQGGHEHNLGGVADYSSPIPRVPREYLFAWSKVNTFSNPVAIHPQTGQGSVPEAC